MQTLTIVPSVPSPLPVLGERQAASRWLILSQPEGVTYAQA